MATDLVPASSVGEDVERVLVYGDLSKLTAEQRVRLVNALCAKLGLNPLTRPFEFIVLNGKLTLYARKDAAEQLRKLHGVSITDLSSVRHDDVFVVTAKATDAAGRTDVATGAVVLTGLRGEALANALMKAETKAKRRVTLSICGLGMLDESELPATDTPPARPALEMTDLAKDAPSSPPITPAQAKRLWTLAKHAGWKEDEVKALYERHGFTRTADITRDQYDAIVAELEGWTDAVPQEPRNE